MSISYSSNNGKYQTEVNKLQELIPKYGSCDNVFLEQLRIIIRIYYGLNNNGDFSIDNGDYHQEFPKDKSFGNLKIPTDISDFLSYINDLEDYRNQTGDYDDYDDYDVNKPYLELLCYDEQLNYLENVLNESILFAYENVIKPIKNKNNKAF